VKGHGKIAFVAMLTALMSFSPIPVARAQSGGPNAGSGGGQNGGPSSSSSAHDPGPRSGSLGAGRPLAKSSKMQKKEE